MMEILPWLGLSASSFVSIFLMGIQTRNLVASRYGMAFVTSLGIGSTQFVFVRFAASDDALMVLLFGVLPAAIGICCSIYVYDNWVKK